MKLQSLLISLLLMCVSLLGLLTMILLYLVTNLYLVNCQFNQDYKVKPEKCYGDDKLMDRRCCIFPPFFKRDVARSCGALFSLVDIYNEHNVTNLRREHNNDCDYWKCMLDKYSMLDSGDKLVIENYFTHLDRWTSLNPDFSTVVSNAKMHCHEHFRLYLPLTTCEFFEFQKCIRAFVNVHCPVIVQSKECLEWKEFYEECREFYL